MPFKRILGIGMVLGVIGVFYVVKKRYLAYSEGFVQFPDPEASTVVDQTGFFLSEEDMATEAIMVPLITQALETKGEFQILHKQEDACYMCGKEAEVGMFPGFTASHMRAELNETVLHRIWLPQPESTAPADETP